jgi:NAD-dependent SIR2 family protein deacetylase
VLKLQDIYGDTSVQPDAEHRFLALLIAEDIVTELVTTNWDPLIELAGGACSSGAVHTIRIVARNEEVSGSHDAGARLLKIHGCARKALRDPPLTGCFW